MGIKDFFGAGEQKGIQCERGENGEQHCTRFMVKDGQRISSGSTVTFVLDPETCQVVMGGNVNSIMDDEAEDFAKVQKAMEQGCRRGLA